MLGVLCFSFDAKAGIPVIAAQQRIKGISCGNDAWDCLDTLQHLGIETARLCRRVTVERWVHGKEQDVVRIKPGIDAFQVLERAHQQTGAREGQNSECYLGDHEAAA